MWYHNLIAQCDTTGGGRGGGNDRGGRGGGRGGNNKNKNNKDRGGKSYTRGGGSGPNQVETLELMIQTMDSICWKRWIYAENARYLFLKLVCFWSVVVDDRRALRGVMTHRYTTENSWILYSKWWNLD